LFLGVVTLAGADAHINARWNGNFDAPELSRRHFLGVGVVLKQVLSS